MKGNKPTPDTLLDAALVLATDRHWEAVRLYDVARHLNISLAALHEVIPASTGTAHVPDSGKKESSKPDH